MYCEYGADSLSSQLVSAVATFKGIYSHLKNISAYRFYLTSYVWRYVIMVPLSS